MPELPADVSSPSRRGSEEPLDFQPSEHAIDLLKEFVALPANSRGSITSAFPPSSFLLNAQTAAAAATASATSPSSPSSASVIAMPATTSLPLLERMQSLSSQLSRFLSSPPARRSPPLDHEEIHRVLLAAEGENAKRAIPSFHAFAEQVQAMTAVDALTKREAQVVRLVGGEDEEVMGRRWRLEAAAKRRAAGEEREEVKDAGEPETARIKREEQRQRDTLNSAIVKLEAAIADAQRCGLTTQQWSMLSAQSALSHLMARRDFFSNRDAFTAAAAAPQPFMRDRLLTAAAHLNAHRLVADGRLPAMDIAGWQTEGAPATVVMNVMSDSPFMTTARSPAASPLLSSHQPLHRAFHGLSPAFSPVQITAETTVLSSASNSHSASVLPVPTSFSLDSLPVTRSPSQSISSDKAHLSDIRTRSASPSVSCSAPPPPATPSASSAVVRMGGFLRKKSPASFILSSWQTRYFRLSSSALSYYQDAAPASACLGAVPLSGIREVRERGPVTRRGSKGEQRAWRFDVMVDGDRTFELEAAAEEEGRVWLSKIREQVEAWHEKSKLATHDSRTQQAATSAAAGAARAAKEAAPKHRDRKWWKDRTFVNKLRTKEGGAAGAAAKARQDATRPRQDSRSGHAALSIGQRVGRGELETLREDATLAACVGRAVIVRDRARPLPAAFRRSFPAMTPPSSSPSYSSMTPPGSSSSSHSLPSAAVVRRCDGLYLLHLLPPSTPPAIVAALFDSMSCLSHPSLLLPVLRGESSDSSFTLYSPGLPSPSSSCLSAHLARLRRFDVDSVRHVALHLILTLGFLHCEERRCGRLSADTAHMAEEGEIIVADLLLGLSCRQRVQLVKGGTGDEEERVEGKVEYMSPEQLRQYERLHRPGQAKDGDDDEEEQSATRMADWWRLGVLLYELSTGTLPFYLKLANYTTAASVSASSSPALISSSSAPAARAAARARLLQVLQANAANSSFLRFPASTPRQLQSLISSLLTVDAEARLGAGNDWRDVLAHPFFDGCGLDVTQVDLLDRLTSRLPPFLLQHILEPAGAASAGSERGGAAAVAPAAPYYSYRYCLSLTAHRAANVRLPSLVAARPSTPSQAAAAPRPVPALYVHLCIDRSTQVTSTISGTESPQWSQAFDFPLPIISSRGQAASEEAAEGEERTTEEALIGEKVDVTGGDGAGGEWEGCRVRVEVRHQLRTSTISHSDQPLYECVGLAECSVAQLLQMHRHALASASALESFTRPASQSVSVSYSASGAMATAPPAPSSSFCLSLLGADGLPNGELHVDMAVREERSVARDRAEEERWQGRHISASDLFGGLGDEAERSWDRERRGGRQLAGREEERFVESAAPIATPAAAILLHGQQHTASKSALRLRRPPQRQQQQEELQRCQRYQQDGFDLDLSRITTRILCASLPDTEGRDVRHSSAEMERFLRAKHAGQCRVLRLLRKAAAEDAKGLELNDCAPGSRVWHVEGDVIALWQLLAWCAEAEDWLSSGDDRVLLLQCEDGLQLSCFFISAFLLFDGFCDSVETAVKLCHARRCLPDADIATVVSSAQHRQLSYLQQMLTDDSGLTADTARVPSRPLRLLHVRLSPPVDAEQLSIRIRTVGPASYLLYDSSSSSAPQPPPLPHPAASTGWDVDGVVCSGDLLLTVADGDGGCVLDVYWHSSFIINHHLCVKAGQMAAQQCELFFSAVED